MPSEPMGVELARSETYVVAVPYMVVLEALERKADAKMKVLFTSEQLNAIRKQMEVVDFNQMVALVRLSQVERTRDLYIGRQIETVHGDLLFWHPYAYVPRECRFVVFGRDGDRLVVIEGLARAPRRVRFSVEHTTLVLESRRQADWFDLVVMRIRQSLR